ncbi:hypothetical protein BS17DRAFT_61348 [Gyrodon lividus]|nr:hypothetical protein BS17DRAFT_61348 [Gyrodon lividus]
MTTVEYVWKRPRSWVSILFVVVRYVGCLNAMAGAFFGSTFVPGPVTVRTVLNLIEVWTFFVFLGVADLLMILRVYAMCNRSRIVLTILLVIYIPIIILLVVPIMYITTQKFNISVTVPEVVNVKLCVVISNPTSLSSCLCHLHLHSPVHPRCYPLHSRRPPVRQESLEMHKAIKTWQSNRYMELLVRESILYANLIYNVGCLINNSMAYIILNVISCIFPYIHPRTQICYQCAGITHPCCRGARRYWVWRGFATHDRERRYHHICGCQGDASGEYMDGGGCP